MLNELSQVVDSLERLGTTTQSRHRRINPMGKNRDLLVVCVAKDGSPRMIEVLPGEKAATLFRVEHGSAGSSFPGFNLPTPLRRLDEVQIEKLTPAVEDLLAFGKNKNTSNAALASSIGDFSTCLRHVFSLAAKRNNFSVLASNWSWNFGRSFRCSRSRTVEEFSHSDRYR